MIDVDPELAAFIKEEYDRCADQTLDEERENAIDRYNGEPYGDEEDGASQVVSRDTSETVDYMVISILRTLVSGERVVEFTHRNVDMAHEATEAIYYLLMEKQDGYMILHDWLKAGLLEKNAVAMSYAEMGEKKRVEGIMPAPMIDETVIEAEPAGTDPATGVELFKVVALQEAPPEFCDAAVPNEEFYCSPDARTITEAAIKGRRVRLTLSELVERGFDREEVESISSDGYYNNQVSNARDEDRNNELANRSGMARRVWWHEEYVTFDANGDGIAETLYVQRSADHKIFAIEEVDDDDHPYVDWCPFPMPHRRIGQSLADKVMDIERVNTVLLRQTLNGIYLSNNPSTYLHEDSIGENTIEDILTVRAGRVIRYKGGVEPRERTGAFDPSVGFTALEFMDRRRESRTGITRLNMGLDEDTLNQTAKGQAQLIARGEQVEEYVARNFANAVAKLITKKAKLLKRFGKPITVPIDGKYKEIDPTQWPEDMIARARVGLGASRKDARIVFRREVLGMQQAAFQAGLSIVDEDKFYNSAKGFVADAGLGDVSEYFNEPPKDEQGNPIPKPQQPDPEMVKAQGEMQLKAQDQQFQQQASAAKIQQAQAESQAKLELARMEAAAQQELARQKAEFEAQLARDKAAFEAEMAQQKMAMDAQLQAQRMASDHEAKMSQNRDGGRLDA